MSTVENQKKETTAQKTEKHESSTERVSITTIDTNDILFRLALRKEKIKQIREKRSKLLSKL